MFRLGAAEPKGAFCLIEACNILRANGFDVALRIGGSGQLDGDLMEVLQGKAWAHLSENMDEETLAKAYDWADVFVLATRFRSTRRPFSGEGFGIVLIEAALAGLPVVAPASGAGTLDAYIPGVTGTRPLDESPKSLADAILSLASLPGAGSLGKQNAISRFSPSVFKQSVSELLQTEFSFYQFKETFLH